MKRLTTLKLIGLLVIISSLLSLSCGSKQARYYMLSSSPELAPVASGGGAATVGVGPVKLPDYLMRPEIVTLTGGNEVKLAEFDRWVEPLDETIVRVLAEDLSGLLPDAHFLQYPWSRSIPLDYRVKVVISGFELQPGGQVRLEADWSITDGEGATLKRRKAESLADVTGKGYTAVVSAMNAALGELSREIAKDLTD